MSRQACAVPNGAGDHIAAGPDDVPGHWGPALALDIVVVMLFAALGRLAHTDGSLLVGTVGTAAPFMLGLLAGWLRAPCAGIGAASRARTVRFGWWLLAWTLGGGMVVRWATGEGTALAFVLVAAVVLGTGLVGRRWLARALRAR